MSDRAECVCKIMVEHYKKGDFIRAALKYTSSDYLFIVTSLNGSDNHCNAGQDPGERGGGGGTIILAHP